MTKVSLKTIAKELGVSTATVSLVLNGKDKNGRVSKNKAQLIRQKAEELNYMPNSIAKSLRVGNSKTLGLIVADITNVFFGSLAFHIQENAEKAGYAVIIGNTNEDINKMNKMVNLLMRRQVDGFIITPTEGSEYIVQDILSRDIPIVLVDRHFPDIQVNSVTINNHQISYEAVNSLIEKGCRKIGLLVYYSDHQTHMNNRKRGYVQAVAEAGIYDEDLVKEVRFETLEEDIRNAINDLLAKQIDGLFFATNSISMLGLRKIISKNDPKFSGINYMCFDENDAYNLLPFKIPYIKQPIQKIAKKTIDQIIVQIKDGNDRQSIVENSVIKAELILE